MDNTHTHTGKDRQHLLRETERYLDTTLIYIVYRYIKNLHLLCVRQRETEVRESKQASERVSLASGNGSVCLQQRRSADKAELGLEKVYINFGQRNEARIS